MGFLRNIYKLVVSKQNMDYDKFGILITILIVGSMFGYVAITDNWVPGISSLIPEQVIPEVVESEERLDNAYYEWCYKMKLEC